MADPDSEIDTMADALYGVSLRDFTAERKRLTDQLRRAGQRQAASEFAKLPRPSLSAWVVNQLFRKARPEFDALLASAARIRAGDMDAVAGQRSALGRLRTLAAEILRGDDHAVSDQTLARATITLQALAATGAFEPDAPGRLTADRDPPGFEAMAGFVQPVRGASEPPRLDRIDAGGLRAGSPANSQSAAAGDQRESEAAEQARAAAELAAQRVAAEAAARAEAEARERKRRAAELERLRRTAEQARRDLLAREARRDELREVLGRAEAAVAESRARAEAAERAVLEAQASLDER